MDNPVRNCGFSRILFIPLIVGTALERVWSLFLVFARLHHQQRGLEVARKANQRKTALEAEGLFAPAAVIPICLDVELGAAAVLAAFVGDPLNFPEPVVHARVEIGKDDFALEPAEFGAGTGLAGDIRLAGMLLFVMAAPGVPTVEAAHGARIVKAFGFAENFLKAVMLDHCRFEIVQQSADLVLDGLPQCPAHLVSVEAFAEFALLVSERLGEGFDLFGVKVLRGDVNLV